MRNEPPQELQDLPQWCVWFLLQRGRDVTKPPCNPLVDSQRPLEERLARPNDPKTWGTYRQARNRYLSPPRVYQGIGFVFTSQDPYCGLDLDHCINGGKLAPWARNVMRRLRSYTELSPSGEGIHIYVRANLQETVAHLNRSVMQHKDPTGRVEIYDTLRYFTWTGRHVRGTPTTIEPRQQELNALYQEWFPKQVSRTEAVEVSQPFDLSDEELIERASRARGGSGERFARLWRGDCRDYRNPHTGQVDESRVDLALLGMLAYWTGKDPQRMERLFKQSGLYRAHRWNAPARTGETYGSGSMRMAIANCYRVYDQLWKPRQ